MVNILGLSSVLAFILGAGAFFVWQDPLHIIASLILFLISAVFFCGGTTLEALNKISKQLPPAPPED